MSELNEIDLLKSQADLLGITYHPNIGLDKLKEKIAFATSKEVGEEAVEAKPAKSEAQVRAEAAAEATKLIRIRLTCMDPSKADFHGEIITVGNSVVGTLRKYVPFNTDEGWHVPYMIYEVLRDRQCQVFTTTKTKNGIGVRTGKLIKEFAIDVLPPLTPEELKELAQRQAMSNSVEG